MSDGPILHRQILENPEDDTLRLVYADWLQENGQPERAEFIRVQVELAANAEQAGLHQGEPDEQTVPCQACVYYKRLRIRQKDLLIGSPTSWGANGQFSDFLSELGIKWDHVGTDPRWRYDRGFVSHIELPCTDFLEHAKAIFEQHPVTSVRLTDKVPDEVPHGSFWWYDEWESDVNHPEIIPYALWPYPPRTMGEEAHDFDSEQAARDWLSNLCVSYGRKRAGLTPLSESGNPTPSPQPA